MAAAAKPSPLFPPTPALRADSAGTPTLDTRARRCGCYWGELGEQAQYAIWHPYNILFTYTDALICFCTNLCLYTRAFGGAGLGDTPGHPPPLPPAVSSEQGGILTDFAPATWSRVRAGILCLPTLGVPYAGGEPAHRGIYPTTCPLFN